MLLHNLTDCLFLKLPEEAELRINASYFKHLMAVIAAHNDKTSDKVFFKLNQVGPGSLSYYLNKLQ